MGDLRAQAESFMDQGAPLIAAAFNLAGSRAWRFDPETRAGAERLLRELVELFHEADIEAATPKMIPWGDPRLRDARAELQQNMRWIAAREDETFQAMLWRFTSRVIAPQEVRDRANIEDRLRRRQRLSTVRSAAAKRAWARRKAPPASRP